MDEFKLVQGKKLGDLIDKLKSEIPKNNVQKYIEIDKIEEGKIFFYISKYYLSFPLELFQVREADWENLRNAYSNAGYAINAFAK